MNRLVLRVRRSCSAEGGRQGKRCLTILVLLACIAGPASLGSVEVNELTSAGESSLAKRFEEEDWNRNAPVDIRSEEMTVDFEKHQIVFKGNVKVVQADFSLTAGEVTALFGESAEDIKKIIASEDVKIRKADKMAWGEEAVYDREGATILLTGTPVLKQGRNFIKGREIQFSLDQDRMEVKGSVEAEFVLTGREEGFDGSGTRSEIGERGQGPNPEE